MATHDNDNDNDNGSEEDAVFTTTTTIPKEKKADDEEEEKREEEAPSSVVVVTASTTKEEEEATAVARGNTMPTAVDEDGAEEEEEEEEKDGSIISVATTATSSSHNTSTTTTNITTTTTKNDEDDDEQCFRMLDEAFLQTQEHKNDSAEFCGGNQSARAVDLATLAARMFACKLRGHANDAASRVHVALDVSWNELLLPSLQDLKYAAGNDDGDESSILSPRGTRRKDALRRARARLDHFAARLNKIARCAQRGRAAIEDRARAFVARANAVADASSRLDHVRVLASSAAAAAFYGDSDDDEEAARLLALRQTHEWLEPAVLALSDGLEICRRVSTLLFEEEEAFVAYANADAVSGDDDNNDGKKGTWTPPSTFERTTIKFWVRNCDVTALRILLSKHLPILVFGHRQGDLATELGCEGASFRYDTFAHRIGDVATSAISSVYLDDEKQSVYHERLLREDLATLLRVRWYSETRDASDGGMPLFLERKTHRDAWTGETSRKERAPIRQSHVVPFLNGELGGLLAACDSLKEGDREDERCALLRDAYDMVKDNGLAPSVRTAYRRMAFQSDSDNAVRASLDTQLHFVREKKMNAKDDWCLSDDDDDVTKGAVPFPYAVFELKTAAEPPEWVESLLESGLVVQAMKFSKFLTATCLLRSGTCVRTPYWMTTAADDEGRLDVCSIDELDMAIPEPRWELGMEPLVGGGGGGNPAEEKKKEKELEEGGGGGGGDDDGNSSILEIDDTAIDIPPLREFDVMMVDNKNNNNRKDTRSTTSTAITSASWPSRIRRSFRRISSVGGSSRDIPPPIPKGRVVRTRIEPKTFFAAERTLLSWLQVAVLILLISLSLLSNALGGGGGGGVIIMPQGEGAASTAAADQQQRAQHAKTTRLVGIIFGPVAIAVMAYAIAVYHWRTRAILSRAELRYDDTFGPTALVLILIVICVVCVSLAAMA